MIRKEDGTVKLLVYRNTYQYLKFTSHHPLHQKLGFIKRYWIDAQHRIRARGQRDRGGADHQSTRKMWGPKLDHEEGDKTAISEGKTKEKKEKNTVKTKGIVTLPYAKQNLYRGF